MKSLTKLRKVFSDRLCELRSSRGWRQTDLAAASGVASGTIANYEQQKRWPQPEDIEALAAALEVDPLELFINAPQRIAPTPEECLKILADYVAAKRGQK